MKSKILENIFIKFIFKILILDIIAIVLAIIFCIITKNLNIKYFSSVISYIGIFLCGLPFILYLGQIEYQRRIAGYGLTKQFKEFREESGLMNSSSLWEILIAGIIILLLSSLLGTF
jgi:hypothetical protein